MKQMKRILVNSLFLTSLATVCVAAEEASFLDAQPKSQWGGHDFTATGLKTEQYKVNGKINHISIHYTQSRPTHERWTEAELLRFVQEGHQNRHGFGDVAYHYVVGHSGTIYAGRDPKIAPATHTHYYSESELANATYGATGKLLSQSVPKHRAPGETEGHITVTFLVGKGLPETLPNSSMKIGAELIASLLIEHNLQPNAVRAHREIATTECPGDAAYKWLRGPKMSQDGVGQGMELINAAFRRHSN